MAEDHKTIVKHQWAYNEYRPECSCGWTGSYWSTKIAANREADRHIAAEMD